MVEISSNVVGTKAPMGFEWVFCDESPKKLVLRVFLNSAKFIRRLIAIGVTTLSLLFDTAMSIFCFINV